MMSRMVPMKSKLWMSEVEMKDGVDAYFFRADKSDCNGYYHLPLTHRTLCPYNGIGL